MRKLRPSHVFILLLFCLCFSACRIDMGKLTGLVNFSGVPCQPGQPDFHVPPCTGPYPNYKVEIRQATNLEAVAVTAMTDSHGNFSIDLPVGEYVIYTQNGPMEKNRKETRFKIEKDKTSTVQLSISTGIL